MTTTLTATPLPDQAAVRLRVQSTQVNDTPVLDIEFGMNSVAAAEEGTRWSPSSSQFEVRSGYVSGGGFCTILRAVAGASTIGGFSRLVTGLTVGTRYRMEIMGRAGTMRWGIGISGIGAKTVAPSTNAYAFEDDGGWLTYEFVATATTHTIWISPAVTPPSQADFVFHGLIVRPIVAPVTIAEEPGPPSTQWSNVSIPSGVGVTETAGSSNEDAWLKVRLAHTSGTPTVQAGGGTRTYVTGLTVGTTYTFRMAVASTAYLNGSTAPFRSTLGVSGKGDAGAVLLPATGDWIRYTFTATSTAHYVQLVTDEPIVMGAGDWLEWTITYWALDAVIPTPLRSLTSLTRSDANGLQPVRLYEGQDMSGGLLVVQDYEAALSGLVTYTAVVGESGTGLVERATASVTDLLPDAAVLAPATLPQYLERLELVTGFEGTRDAQTTVHDVVGRADPLVVLGPLGTRRGLLSVWCRSYAAGLAVQAVYTRGEVALLRQAYEPGLDLYHVATSTSLGMDGTRWRVSVTFVEVDAPLSPLLGSTGWTFDQASAQYPTFQVAMATFPTFNEYTAGVA